MTWTYHCLNERRREGVKEEKERQRGERERGREERERGGGGREGGRGRGRNGGRIRHQTSWYMCMYTYRYKGIDDRQMTFDPFCQSQGFKAILRGPLQSHYSWWPISTRNLWCGRLRFQFVSKCFHGKGLNDVKGHHVWDGHPQLATKIWTMLPKSSNRNAIFQSHFSGCIFLCLSVFHSIKHATNFGMGPRFRWWKVLGPGAVRHGERMQETWIC